MIRLTCLACGQEFECSDFLAGLTIVCKSCGNRMLVPGGRRSESSAGEGITFVPGAIPAAPIPNLAGSPPRFENPAVEPPPCDSTPLKKRAETMLDAGIPVPQIEQSLVALGLPSDVAKALLTKVLDERALREEKEAMEREDREEDHLRVWVSRRLASRWWIQLLISGGCFLCAIISYSNTTKPDPAGERRWHVFFFVIAGIICAFQGIRKLKEAFDELG